MEQHQDLTERKVVSEMAKRKNLVKPKPSTLKRAEADLRSRAGRKVKGPAGYVVRNAKGVKARKGK